MITIRLRCIHHPHSCAQKVVKLEPLASSSDRCPFLYGNILESLQRVQQFSEVDVTEFEFVTMMMSETSRATNFYQFLRVHRARSRRVAKKHLTPEPYTRATFQRKLRRLFRRCVTFLWRQTQVWLSWTLERLKLLDPQRHTNPSFQQQVMFHEKVEMDVEAGRTMTFKVADGTTTCAYSLVWMQTPHGCFSTYIIDSNRSSDAAECQRDSGRHKQPSILPRTLCHTGVSTHRMKKLQSCLLNPCNVVAQ